jgi:hypothetical protein
VTPDVKPSLHVAGHVGAPLVLEVLELDEVEDVVLDELEALVEQAPPAPPQGGAPLELAEIPPPAPPVEPLRPWTKASEPLQLRPTYMDATMRAAHTEPFMPRY